MVEKIQKLRNGQRVSRQDWEAAKAAFETAYQDATPEQKAQVDGYIQSMQNYSNANPMNNRSQREYETEGYNIATRILNGDTSNIHRSIGATTKNVFNGYSHAENKANAANVYVDYTMRNKAKSMVQPATSTSSTLGARPYAYNWANGLDSDWTSDTDTLEERMGAFADAIRTNLNAARNSGKKVVGITDDEISQALALLNKETWTKDDLKTLRKAAQLAHVDAAAYKSYFGDLMPGQSPQEKAKAQWTKQGYTDVDLNTDANSSAWLRNYAKQKGYHIMRDKEGNYRIFNDNYDNPLTNILDYDYNYDDKDVEGSGFGHTLIADENGNVYFGDYKNIGKDSPFANLWNTRLTTDRSKRDRLYFDINYDSTIDDAESPYLQALETKFGKFKGSDVSSLFQGDDKIFVMSKDGTNPYYDKDSIFGGIRFNSNAKFYKVGDDGSVNEVSWDQLKPLYNNNGWDGETEEQIGKKIDLNSKLDADTTTFDDTMDMGGRSYWDAIKDNYGFGGQWWHIFYPKGLLNNAITYASYDNVNEDRIGFIHNLLNAVGNHGQGELHTKLSGVAGNADLLSKLKYNEKKAYYIKGLYDMFKNDPSLWDQLSSQEKATFKAMKREYNGMLRHGGIISAAKGTVLTPSGEILEVLPFENPSKTKSNADIAKLRARYEKANSEGYGDDIYRMDASKAPVFKGNTSMTAADIMRLTTMAQDVASIVASFVPGAGTGVSAGLGVTSMLTDLGADLMDPAVSGGEVAKNLAMNAGFAALGMIPGAKTGKVVKNLVKWAPKIMTITASMGIAMDESTQKTFAKLGDGTQKLNREDWRNISHVLSLVAGGTRGVRQDVANFKTRKVGTIAADNVKVKGVKAVGSDKELELPKKTIKEINTKLKDAKTPDEAKAKLLEFKNENGTNIFTEEQVNSLIQEQNWLKSKTGQKFKIDTSKLEDSASKEEIDKSYDKIREIWNKDADALEKQSKTWYGKAAIAFADKLGGGAYGANQRALIQNEALSSEAAKMAYQGYYNPMIDYKGIRRNAGMHKMPERTIQQQATPESTNTPLPLPPHTPINGSESPKPYTPPYNGDDLVADGIHQRTESPKPTPIEPKIPVVPIEEVAAPKNVFTPNEQKVLGPAESTRQKMESNRNHTDSKPGVYPEGMVIKFNQTDNTDHIKSVLSKNLAGGRKLAVRVFNEGNNDFKTVFVSASKDGKTITLTDGNRSQEILFTEFVKTTKEGIQAGKLEIQAANSFGPKQTELNFNSPKTNNESPSSRVRNSMKTNKDIEINIDRSKVLPKSKILNELKSIPKEDWPNYVFMDNGEPRQIFGLFTDLKKGRQMILINRGTEMQYIDLNTLAKSLHNRPNVYSLSKKNK